MVFRNRIQDATRDANIGMSMLIVSGKRFIFLIRKEMTPIVKTGGIIFAVPLILLGCLFGRLY